MTKQEIEKLLGLGISEIAKHGNDPQIIVSVWNLGFQQGYLAGNKKAHEDYHTAFTKYSEETLAN